MECYYCERNEHEVNNVFNSLVNTIQSKISVFDNQINKLKVLYKNKNLFNNENFGKIKSIDKNLLNMEINYLKKNIDVLIKLESNLNLLMLYLTEFNPNISETAPLLNLANNFLSESNDEMPLVREIANIKNKLILDINKVNKKIEFYELGPEEAMIVYEFKKELLVNIINNCFYEIYKDNNKYTHKFLCPFCYHIFEKKFQQIEINKLRGKYDGIKEWDLD